MKRGEALGFMVLDSAEMYEQPLRLVFGDDIPPLGILEWRDKPSDATTVFASRADARAAIDRTHHYARAFCPSSPGLHPQRECCKVVMVARAPVVEGGDA